MPELPEVESVRLGLVPRLVGRTVVAAALLRRDVLVAPGDPHGGFSRQRKRRAQTAAPFDAADLLEGARIVELRRRGKQLAIVAGSGRVLVVQLGMTGHLEFSPAASMREKHVHAEWTLDEGVRLVFRDPRRFGSLRVFRSLADLDTHWLSIPHDALNITPATLRVQLMNTRRPVKAALLDQSVLAGVGNIYADEALFAAGIHPAHPAHALTAAQCRRLVLAVRRVLCEAIRKGGSTVRDYANAEGHPGSYTAQHRVYGRGGQPCTRCGERLVSASLAQRTTVWCPSCQPRPRRTPATRG